MLLAELRRIQLHTLLYTGRAYTDVAVLALPLGEVGHDVGRLPHKSTTITAPMTDIEPILE